MSYITKINYNILKLSDILTSTQSGQIVLTLIKNTHLVKSFGRSVTSFETQWHLLDTQYHFVSSMLPYGHIVTVSNSLEHYGTLCTISTTLLVLIEHLWTLNVTFTGTWLWPTDHIRLLLNNKVVIICWPLGFTSSLLQASHQMTLLEK